MESRDEGRRNESNRWREKYKQDGKNRTGERESTKDKQLRGPDRGQYQWRQRWSEITALQDLFIDSVCVCVFVFR